MSPYQKVQLERLRLGSFNSMDGDTVADLMEKNENLWDTFMFGRFSPYGGNLIELRDLKDCINADTLLILTDKKNWPELQKLLQDPKLEVDELGMTAADDEVWGVAPYRDAKEVNTEMGGGFWVKEPGGNDFPAPLAKRFGKQPDPENIPVLVRVWWD